jgi:hypothetical protein
MKKTLLFLIMISFLCNHLSAQITGLTDGSNDDPRANPQAVLPELTVDPGTIFKVPVKVNDMVSMSNLKLRIKFDSDIITFNEIIFDGGVLASNNYVKTIRFFAPDLIEITFDATFNIQFTGSGSVAFIICTAGERGTSPLTFEQFEINGHNQLFNVINGSVHIDACLDAIANAGSDGLCLVNQNYTLNGTAQNYESVLWQTQGDGSFNNASLLNAVYTPGSQDIMNGAVNLCLTAFALDDCADNTDCMNLNIGPKAVLPDLNVDAGATFSVPVTIFNMPPVQELTVRIKYDNAIINYQQVIFEGGVLAANKYTKNVSIIGPDEIQITFTALFTSYFSGSGDVAFISFQAGDHGTSELDFTTFTLNGQNYLGNVVNGSVHIGECYDAVANAGIDALVLVNQSYTLNGTAQNYESVLWQTSGDGTFNNPVILNATYTPGPQDIINATANLCLTAFATDPCSDNTDCMNLNIGPQAVLPHETVDPGETFLIPVTVNNTPALQQLIIRTNYDNSIISFDQVIFEGGVLAKNNYIKTVNFIEPDIIEMTFTATFTNYFKGSGIVAFIQFTAGNYGTSDLIFTQFSVNGQNYLSNVINGSVFIDGCLDATSNAGSDDQICQDQNYALNGTAENFQSLLWLTQGDGTFDDSEILTPVYTPGPQDISTGSVSLCLTAFAVQPCNDFTDCMLLEILPVPELTCQTDFEICVDAEPITLEGSLPVGGVYSGTGIINNVFDPSIAGLGEHSITYYYIDSQGCSNTCIFVITVNPLPEISCPVYEPLCAGAPAFELLGGSPLGGVYTDAAGLVVTTFDPAVGAGTYSFTYSFTDIHGCSASCDFEIVVNALPEVTCPTYEPLCADAPAFEFSGGFPEGGVYTNAAGLVVTTFDPAIGAGTYSFTYSYEDGNGCSASCDFSISVTPMAIVHAGDDATICQDNSSLQLNGSVENASEYFWYTLMGSGYFDNEFSLNPTYFPGDLDYLLGSVELCLQAVPVSLANRLLLIACHFILILYLK